MRFGGLVGLPSILLRNMLKERRCSALLAYFLVGVMVWSRKRRRYKILHAAAGLLVLWLKLSRPPYVPYTTEIMALDSIRLLDSLGILHAHIVGYSMGGMIAQTLAREHPRRVLSLVLMATIHPSASLHSTNIPFTLVHSLTSSSAFDPLATKEKRLQGTHRFWQNISTTDSHQEELQKKLASEESDRGAMDVDAMLRQLMAVLSFTLDDKPQLEPPRTTVIHGLEDPLIPLAHGLELAKAMKCHRCVVLPNLGHDLLPGGEEEVFIAIKAHLMDSAGKAGVVIGEGSGDGRNEPIASWDVLRKSPSVTLLTKAHGSNIWSKS